MGFLDTIGSAFSDIGNAIVDTTSNVIETTGKVAENVGSVALHQVENVGKAVVFDFKTLFTKPQNLLSNFEKQLKQQGNLISTGFNKIVEPVIKPIEKIIEPVEKEIEKVIKPIEKVIEKEIIEPVYDAVIKPIGKELEKIIMPEPVKVNTNKLIVDNLETIEHIEPVNIYPDDTNSLVGYTPDPEETDNTIYYILGIGALFFLTKR